MSAKMKTCVFKRKFLTTGGLWLLAVLCLTALVVGQEEITADPADSQPTEEITVTGQAVQTPSVQSLQSITFRKDMPIRDALQMLAQMYHKNIVPSARVDGTVTVTNLYDVTFEEALQAILGTHKYEIKGNFVRVYTNEEFMADKTRFEHAIITLHYVNSEEAKKLATPLLSEFGQLGTTTPAPSEMEAGRGGDTLAIHDRLVVSDYPENIRRIREVLAEVDTEPIQVLLEVTVMEATLTEETKFGIDWTNLSGVDISSGISQGMNGVSTDFAPALSSIAGGGTGGLIAGITFDNISAIVTAVETVSDVTIMANPKILALNKQAGKLIIGEEEGYQSLTNTNADGATQQVEFLESGTILEFRPFIGRDGMIRMEIHPEQSIGSIEGGLPNKSTTEIVTNVMVRDGQTIVLGGLFKEETNLGRNQVPLLGDIPVIGELFRGVVDKSDRVELIVLITPHIINTPEEADGADRLEDVMRLASNARESIYWMSRVKQDEDRYARAVEQYVAGNYEAALTQLAGCYPISPRNYLDAIRLREKILREMDPEKSDQLQWIMIHRIEQEQSGKWMRR